ncbi:MAG: LysE family translocator [Nocardioidaceae bacterium]
MPGLIWPLLLFAVVVVVSPGANNLLAASSGLRFGLRASLGLLAGLGLGVISVVVLAAAGLGAVVTSVPQAQTGLRTVGTAYLLWLAVQIARSGRPESTKASRTPRGFAAGLLVSWLNPKVWVLGITAVAGYSAVSSNPLILSAVLGGVFAAVVAPNLVLWCGCGQTIATKLTTDRQWHVANLILAALLVMSITLMWAD